MSFPDGFVWGAAAASYQVEGAAHEGGRGPSVWDMMCRKEGAILDGHTGDVSCDHYHRYAEDVALMKEIGLHAYRLSVSWSRVLPEGIGEINERGLDFYDRLVDELLAADIQPWVTLFHWDYPLALYYRGGWLNRESIRWFADYAMVLADRLSDRVQHWMTLNEPLCFVHLGHRLGTHAPGDKLALAEVLRVAHHALTAHGSAIQVLRAEAKTPPKVGMALNGQVCVPDSDSEDDIAAARELMFSVREKAATGFAWYGDPMILGRYPEDGVQLFGDDMPPDFERDLSDIHQTLDFFGLNCYHGLRVRAGDCGPEVVPRPAGHAQTAFRWPVEPEALRWGPRFLHERYSLPIVVTENGLSNQDWIALDGRVHDSQRIDFLQRYLLQFERAGEEGAPIEGYFQWSILDNFEWAYGYRERFGLIYVDYQTLERTPKDSAYWYSDVIRSNGSRLHEDIDA